MLKLRLAGRSRRAISTGLSGLARRSGGAAVPLLAAAVLLGAACALLALSLKPAAGTSTFVGSSSPAYSATQRYYESFGEEPVEVVVKGSLEKLLLSEDVDALLGLEGCLSGRVPRKALAGEGGVNGPCGRLAGLKAVKVVIGPATFISEAAEGIVASLERQRRQAEAAATAAQLYVEAHAAQAGLPPSEVHSLGRAARRANLAGFAAEVSAEAVRYGLEGTPAINNRSFVSTLVFSSSAKLPGTPKRRFAYLFPSRDAALISVRLRAGLSRGVRESALAAISQAVRMPQWRLRYGERYLLTGEPLIVSQLTRSISKSVLLLLIAVVVAMALTLSLIFRGRPRLLPLAVALLALLATFALLDIALGGAIGVGELAVLPVLTGLSVDYAVQLHYRAQELLQAQSTSAVEAVAAAAGRIGPALLTAAAASAGAILILELSPVPTVQGFATLLAIGIAIALFLTFTVGSAAIVLTARLRRRLTPGAMRGPAGGAMRGAPRAGLRGRGAPAGAIVRRLSASWRGAQELLLDNRFTHWSFELAVARVPRHPVRVILSGLVLAAAGWGLSGLTPVQSDITKLVPEGMPSLRNLATLERLSGVSGELDLIVSGRRITSPAAIEWMERYQSAVLERFASGESSTCGRAPICAAFSLPALLQSSGGAGGGGAGTRARTASKLTSKRVDQLLDAIPSYFSAEAITPDRRLASLSFGIRLMPLSAQQRIIGGMRAMLNPPAGVRASLVGLPVLAASADAAVASASNRELDLLAGLAAAAAVLLVAFKSDLRRALAPLVPVLLASGWSGLLLFALSIPLNPMSVTLGVLVIAISTELSVLLSERYFAERAAGADGAKALRNAYRTTGAAVACSAVTAIVGFAVLVLSEIEMLRNFGLATIVDLGVSLIGVIVVLPAALTLIAGGARLDRAHAREEGRMQRDGALVGAAAFPESEAG